MRLSKRPWKSTGYEKSRSARDAGFFIFQRFGDPRRSNYSKRKSNIIPHSATTKPKGATPTPLNPRKRKSKRKPEVEMQPVVDVLYTPVDFLWRVHSEWRNHNKNLRPDRLICSKNKKQEPNRKSSLCGPGNQPLCVPETGKLQTVRAPIMRVYDIILF